MRTTSAMPSVEVVYEDGDLVVVNKPPGISVHGGGLVKGPTLVDLLVERFPEIRGVGEDPVRPGIVHRLDKDTSGIMAVARTQESFRLLKCAFQDRRVEKTYLAVVCGRVQNPAGEITFPIGRSSNNPVRRGVSAGRSRVTGARSALTRYRVRASDGTYSLVELHPETGRMHQIRVHLKAIGHPVACDTIYGGKRVCCPAGAQRQLLHAHKLSFSIRDGRRYAFEADLPADMAACPVVKQAGVC